MNMELQAMCYSALARRHRVFLSIHAEQTSSDPSKTQNLIVNSVHVDGYVGSISTNITY